MSVLFLFALNMEGCTHINDEMSSLNLFSTSPIKKQNIRFKSVHLDSLVLDSVSTSFMGGIIVQDHCLLFIDQRFCWAIKFDTNGRLTRRYIGQGNAPDELPIKSIQFYTTMQNGGMLFIGPEWDCFVFDSNFKKIDDYGINWNNSTSRTNTKTPNPSQTDIYTLAYGVSPIRADGDNLFLPIISQHPLFNPTSRSYSRDARVLAVMKIKNGNVNKIMGRLPPLYSRENAVNTFSYIDFDLLHNDSMIVGYPVDSLIYIFDKTFRIKAAFGFSGRDMDQHYTLSESLSQFRRNWQSETKTKGYYHSLKCVPERELIFRSYQKGHASVTDGLQIYHGVTLIADVDVPRRFCVEGYIYPYFYSNPYFDEEKGFIWVYRFRI